jgi:hypothetical protein
MGHDSLIISDHAHVLTDLASSGQLLGSGTG